MIEKQAIDEQAWLIVEQFFLELPSSLSRRALLLKNSLTVQYGETGCLQDILSRDGDYPWLSLPIWLLKDWFIHANTQRFLLEKYLLPPSFYNFAAVYLQEQIQDEASFFDVADISLVDALQQQTLFHFQQILGEDSEFWSFNQQLWADYQTAVATMQQHQKTPNQFTPDLLQHHTAQLSPANIPVIAAAIAIDRTNQIPSLLQLMNCLNHIHQMRRDILAIRRDIMRGCYTYPIVRVMQAGDIPLSAKPTPEKLLGAMILTGAIATIGKECLEKLETAKILAQQLMLPSWLQYCDRLEVVLNELIALFSLKNLGKPLASSSNSFIPYIDSLNVAIAAAEQYLLSDLTFRESWDVQRFTLPQKSEVLARAFPMGLIVEILSTHGHNLSSQVAEIFQLLERHHFCYYETDGLPPDTDDLGLLLRLYQYSAQPETHQAILQRPLGWLVQNILPSGEIPVWLTQGIDHAQGFLVWGKSCLAVEINALLGLIAYDWSAYEKLIENSFLNLCQRLIQSGFSGLSHYEPAYCLWGFFQLLTQLETKPISKTVQIQIQQVTPILLQRLQQEIERCSPSPQEAAFFILSCLSHPLAKSLLNHSWIQHLLKHQRYDGSWTDEALYPTVHRGRQVVWYSSRTVTTAFCYHALRIYQKYFDF
ncbi:hypothetical protein IQ276_034275 [Desmonostoc muscorum LEGE 12446]|uniref:Uncharacterized protein n=1 Tax=Desmonostoc muscorum LEGE 12446 TaxID=1828758 RepID=A0A8J6ZLP7_DESMC|nr:hypothetical protein [Desmonostoc muscorum]MCF2151395.1 hypothetical protein [Desmonostoc muscorum LEGE 12446]